MTFLHISQILFKSKSQFNYFGQPLTKIWLTPYLRRFPALETSYFTLLVLIFVKGRDWNKSSANLWKLRGKLQLPFYKKCQETGPFWTTQWLELQEEVSAKIPVFIPGNVLWLKKEIQQEEYIKRLKNLPFALLFWKQYYICIDEI